MRTAEMVYGLDVGSGSLEAAFAVDPAPLFSTPSTNGEAISFDVEGDALWMVDEGASSPLWLVVCEDFDVISESDLDPLLDCELFQSDESCGCSSRQAIGLFGLPFFGWIRRRRNLS